MENGRIGAKELAHLVSLMECVESVRSDLNDISEESINEMIDAIRVAEVSIRRVIAEIVEHRGSDG